MPQEVYDQAPADARGSSEQRIVHWVVDPQVGDDVVEGALWAFGLAFDKLFGSVLGPQLLQNAVDVEERRFGQWVPLA